MKKIKLLSFLMVLLFFVPASAEFYRYLDKNGKIRYTDDYSKVPKSQESSAREYRGYEKDDTDDAKNNETEAVTAIDTEKPSQLPKETEDGQENETSNTEKLDATKRRLEQKQQEINKELDDLNREKSELDALKEKVKTRPQAFEYRSKVEAFNEKIKKFTDKQKVFEAEVEAHNNDLENSMKNSLKRYDKEKKENRK